MSKKEKKSATKKAVEEIKKGKGDEMEKICAVCGNIANKPEEFCEHQKTKESHVQTPKQQELPNMPAPEGPAIIANEILDLKDHIKAENENLGTLKQQFINEMRVKQKSYLLVKGWEFNVDIVDQLNISKKK